MNSDQKFVERRELRETLSRGDKDLVILDVRSNEEFSADACQEERSVTSLS